MPRQRFFREKRFLNESGMFTKGARRSNNLFLRRLVPASTPDAPSPRTESYTPLGSGAQPERNLAMHIVHVFVHVKPGCEAAFETATRANARASLTEPGVARFDVVRQQDDPSRFVLVEVYRSPEAALAHKETAHYATWRDTVADMMAEPRSSLKYVNLHPDDAGW
jgi:quinol monooxygenase YgiN